MDNIYNNFLRNSGDNFNQTQKDIKYLKDHGKDRMNLEIKLKNVKNKDQQE